ncbi:MAG: TIGR03086 family metal-binding protein [Sporichthyaceae bacterium]
MTDTTLDVPEIRARYIRIAAGLDDRIARLSPADWAAPTPCTEWDGRGLLTHVVEVHRGMAAMLTGTAPEPVAPDADLTSAWRTARGGIEAAMADESGAVKVVDTQRFGTMPFAAVVGGLLCADTIVHTWDLSRATGQDERLDPAGVANAFALLKSFGDGIRSPGAFGPAVEPPAGADDQTQFICYCGRPA